MEDHLYHGMHFHRVELRLEVYSQSPYLEQQSLNVLRVLMQNVYGLQDLHRIHLFCDLRLESRENQPDGLHVLQYSQHRLPVLK